jgi:outer membrane protein assembly factor BamB
LLQDENEKIPLGITSDGETLLYRIPRSLASGELWLLPLKGERKPRAFSPGNTSQTPAAVSPNGKWLAYASSESGRADIYVTAFPSGKGKWQVSTGGGDNPRWRADGKELFFTANDRIMAVDVDTAADRFESRVPHALFSARVPAPTLASRATFAPSADGQKFLVNTWDAGSGIAPITLVVNWPETLKK